MKRIISKKALSLIELIIAVMFITIIGLGIFSINNVLLYNTQDYGQRFLVRSQTQVTLDNILYNVAWVLGSGTQVGNPPVLDKGILTRQADGLTNNDFCMHQAIFGPDQWLCYTVTSNELMYCYNHYVLSDPTGLRGADGYYNGSTTNCNVNPPLPAFMGSAYSDSNLNGNPSPPTFTTAAGSPMMFIITLQNCLNNTASSCSSSGVSQDPVNNPEVQITGSAFPLQEGQQQT